MLSWARSEEANKLSLAMGVRLHRSVQPFDVFTRDLVMSYRVLYVCDAYRDGTLPRHSILVGRCSS